MLDDIDEDYAAENDTEALCGNFEGYSTIRFISVILFSLISASGIVFNLLLLAVFRRSLPSSIYLATLSLLDTLICVSYILLFGIDAGFVYLKNEFLFNLYHVYVIYAFYISKIIQFAIPFMLILATLERYVWTSSEQTRSFFGPVFSDVGRCVTTGVLIFLSALLRASYLFAVKVQQFPNCPDAFRKQSVSFTEWALTSDAYRSYEFQFIVALQMVLPFIVLVILNAVIIKRLLYEKQREHSGEPRKVLRSIQMYATIQPTLCKVGEATKKASSNYHGDQTYQAAVMPENYVLLEVATELIKESLITRNCRGKKTQLRNAIYTMLAIVTSYLICNGLHLIVTIMEQFMSHLLKEEGDENMSNMFYVIMSDLVSASYLITSAFRLFIYAKCNPKLRTDIKQFLRNRRIG